MTLKVINNVGIASLNYLKSHKLQKEIEMSTKQDTRKIYSKPLNNLTSFCAESLNIFLC